MAKGQSAAADKNLATTNSAAAGYGSNAANLYGSLVPQAQSLVNSQGYEPATLGAITNAGMGASNAAFDSASGDLKRTAARTANPASIGANEDALARSKGVAGGQEAGNIQVQNANFANSQRTQGLNMLQSLYGTNVGASTNLYGLGPGTLSARAAGAPPAALGITEAALGAGGSVGAAALKG